MGAKEKEVTRLERILAILQIHTWGSGDGEAIANALGGTSRAARACSVPKVPPPLASGGGGGGGSVWGCVRCVWAAGVRQERGTLGSCS